MRLRIPVWLAAVLALAAFVAGSWIVRSCSKPPEVTGSQLTEQGFHTPEAEKPKIPDLPRGSHPVAVLTGRILPVLRSPAPVVAPGSASTQAPPPGTDVPSEAPVAGPISPREPTAPWPVLTDLGGSCDCQLARAGSTVFGRVYWSGTLQGPEGGEYMRRGPMLAQEVSLRVEPGTVPVSRLAFLPRGSRNWRLGVSCGVGLGYDPIRSAPVATAACLWGGQF